MNKEELEIEIKSLQEVLKQFTKGCDPRMEISLDKFLCDIENRIKELQKQLNGT